MLTPMSYFSKLLIGAFSLCLVFLTSCNPAEREVQITSPDSQLQMTVQLQDSLLYSVSYKGKEIVQPSFICMNLTGQTLGVSPKIKKIQKNTVNETITPLYGKFATLQDHYNETILTFEDGYSLILRAYNEGLAYRFVTDLEGEVIVENELMQVNLTGNPAAQYPETNNWTSWELAYAEYETVSAIDKDKKAITPVLFSYPDNTKLVVAEADVLSYPGMYLVKGDAGFHSAYAQYPDSTALGSWGFVSVVQRTRDYIAKTEGKRNYPWRVFILTDDDKTLLTNEIIYKLSEPQRIQNTSWIKPGKAVWEWWHDAMLPGANIPSGMGNRNTALYKFYIDFAAETQMEYLMIDAGWSDIFDLSKINPKVDVQEIIRYGKSKNVDVFLWCVAMALTEETVDKYMNMIHEWGAVGLKVDFFDRDDQLTMDWYEMIAEKAAKYELMINFHGCSKPTGMQRAYPNILNYEAVRGAECSKWDFTANPKHHLIFPFTRMLGGALDYTPGSMRNATQEAFKPVDPGLPSTQGTRCHELAMYVIYDQYFAMLCDSPMEYRKYPDIMKFLSEVPVTFDDTKALDAKVGEYALMAKRKGDKWYVGGMTNWDARTIEVDFDFLSPGVEYQATIIKDAPQSSEEPTQYICEDITVTSATKLQVDMAKGGGFVISLK
ncbi:glycoside hydrolase family 97 protein [Bacteroides sp. 51]|uniref:glycoside hydrolase family 97 protein n=1 Tax=Bacteroides sp. 51 TaxID=2302938 RepID=UPI0013D244C5|nr:glycoside hydrolase family 97 protein [Bacteroides sp. 51]NDV81788.1 glycoside hydrolase family 97 protein [Bacteroides sp. 51]